MTACQMRYGASQDAGSDRTDLKADIAGQPALQVQNSRTDSGAGIVGMGYSGILGASESDGGVGVFGSGTKAPALATASAALVPSTASVPLPLGFMGSDRI